ncbi:quinol:cytochrome C oxidoreductase [Flavobacterium sp. NST-5]|uniref:Quinol:cytochrome C oxidoreductase n=1 Tax=Flavobacterium ichthyis TaxID=2698827 RepID=A0ABW9Z9K5_9FLAO|nr:quinol:cytochrome C oxidoreductase [Flavobacterium ichthyis]NBL64790.1 quinol:cytochrome C oxidoreductase [Flavobacterium ichthyis]
MYTFSSKLKTFSFILMVLGILGIGYGFLTAPKDIAEVEQILKKEAEAHHGHGDAHHADAHASTTSEKAHAHAEATHDTTNAPHAEPTAEAHAVAEAHTDSVVHVSDSATVAEKEHETHAVTAAAHHHDAAGHDDHASHEKHLEHVLHQLQNKPWAAVYVAGLFFMLISLGVLAFYAIQQVAQAGWSPVLFRVMQGITAYLPVGSIIVFILLALGAFHVHHLFVWMDHELLDPTSPKYDKLIANKSGYLNEWFWLIRAAVFIIGWNLYRYFSRKNCLAQDEASDNAFYKKNFKISAGFLVFFIVTESIMSWDWIMSVDPHWFSTLFAWYVFASFFVSGITVIAMVTLYLKSRGYLEYVNTSHIHDLAKFMFGISVFWTYLWFSQFMLIWYADIPEEVTYFITRIEQYNLPFFGMVAMNFLFPVLILINTDFKRLTWIVVMAGIVILCGHYLDFYNMIMPATVGDRWFIGIAEIGSILFFLGLFILVIFTALTKSPLVPKNNPFIEESKHFHY